jgi:ketosteroid isomerase-like protein
MDDVIRRLYEALKTRDTAAFARLYHPEAVFEDPVFKLSGRQVPAMWHMLCEAGQDLEVGYRDVRAAGQSGTGRWEAVYTFSATGRKVRNRITSEFRFRDGKIVQQRDRFDFWRWSRQALGPAGLLLGWTPLLRAKVRKRAAANLAKFLAAHPEYR